MKPAWTRVSKALPCPICGKPDWCCVGERYINCMRIYSERECANGGYLHERKEAAPVNIPIRYAPEPTINCTELIRKWSTLTDFDSVRELSKQLGVLPMALRWLGYVWSGEQWAVPMRDDYGSVCGIQFRNREGFKQTLKGSRVGYFIPECTKQAQVFITEGASDCAAALSMGLYAVGRYNCAQSSVKLGQYLRRNGVRRAIIVSDNDAPGIAGAEKVSRELNMPCCIYTPPTKDLRAMINLGGTRQLIESTVSNLIWRQP